MLVTINDLPPSAANRIDQERNEKESKAPAFNCPGESLTLKKAKGTLTNCRGFYEPTFCNSLA